MLLSVSLTLRELPARVSVTVKNDLVPELITPGLIGVSRNGLKFKFVKAQVAQARNMSIGEYRRASALLHNTQNIRICMGKKPIVSVTYENESISIKKTAYLT